MHPRCSRCDTLKDEAVLSSFSGSYLRVLSQIGHSMHRHKIDDTRLIATTVMNYRKPTVITQLSLGWVRKKPAWNRETVVFAGKYLWRFPGEKNFNRFWEIAQILMHYESMKLHETTIDWQTANNPRYARHFQSYSFADGLVGCGQVSGRTFSSSSEQHTWRSLSGFSKKRHLRRCPTSTLWPHLDFMTFWTPCELRGWGCATIL